MEKTLVLAGAKPKRVAYRVVNKTLEQTTWSVKGVPKVTKKAFDTEHDAQDAFRKAVRKKLREDYAMVAEAKAPGDVILEAFAPGGGGGAVLDMSLDGKRVVTPTITSEQSFGMKLEVVEVETGARHIVAREPGGQRQSFLHAAHFDRAGRGIYFTLNDDTEHVDIATGERRVIARGGGFNPFVTKPSFDRERKRLVVCAEDWTVRVLDADSGDTLLEVPTAAKHAECRGVRISPSGRLLAIYMVSRGIVYSHDDAKADVTNEVQIWDIEAKQKWETVQVQHQLTDVGFPPNDDALLVCYYYALGPVALEIPSGTERWRFDDPDETQMRLARTYAWAYSPAGDRIALAGERVRLFDAKTREEIELPERFGRSSCATFSADGRRLAVAIGGTAHVFAL
jgi:hypothetical protein